MRLFLTIAVILFKSYFSNAQQVHNIKQNETIIAGSNNTLTILNNPTKHKIRYRLSGDSVNWNTHSIKPFSKQKISNSNELWLVIQYRYAKYIVKKVKANSSYKFVETPLNTPWPYSIE